MPFTFFAHQTIVIPLKSRWPRWFDGTALCVGSTAPDLAYALNDTAWRIATHTLTRQLTFTLPLAVALTLVWRHVIAAPLGGVLPGRTGAEVRALARARRPLWLTAIGAVLGGLAHVFMDGFTHADGWAAKRSSTLHIFITLDGHREPVHRWLQLLGHTLGTAVGFALVAVLIARRRFSLWSPGPEAPRIRHPAAMWLPIVGGAAAGALLAARVHDDPATAIIRGAWAAFAGLLLGALASRALARRARGTESPGGRI